MNPRVSILLLLLLLASVSAGSQAPEAPLPQLSGGLKGYISMRITRPPDECRYGVSFYASVWPLIEKPIGGFQIGLPSTWIIPENGDFKKALCPPGTVAGDNWPERGPTYRDVFQTIEGGLGYWVSTQFGSGAPKYRINGTPNCYTHEISSPGWGFGNPKPLTGEQMGIAQLSNRLLIPPDGLTFKSGMRGELLGNAWMALPFTQSDEAHVGEPGGPEIPTGDQSWTLFLNAANFKGPVAYWIPQTWSDISKKYKTDIARGLDARPANMDSGAMEVNTVPYFQAKDAAGVTYTRIPKLLFPVDAQGHSALMQDVKMYAKQALFDTLRSESEIARAGAGKFDIKAAFSPACSTDPISFRQGPNNITLKGIDATLQTKVLGTSIFGLQWTGAGHNGVFPEYFKQVGSVMMAVDASQVPPETHLTTQHFEPHGSGEPYTSPSNASDCWSVPGPKRGPFTVTLSDGSTVTYSWYRFVDQPALQKLHLSDTEKRRLQSLVEKIHGSWKINGEYMPPPTSGSLASLDSALIVTPPRGLEKGYVPIVTRQAMK